MPVRSKRKARIAAMKALYAVDVGGQAPDDAIHEAITAADLAEPYAQFAADAVRGVLTCREELQAVIESHSQGFTFDRMAAVDRCILLLAAWEMQARREDPAIAINEAIEIAKAYSTEDSGRFVNGILGTIARQLPSNEARILDGKQLSKQVREELKVRVAALQERGIQPRLEVLVAAEDPGSQTYVKMKRKWAEEVGILTGTFEVGTTTAQDELVGRIRALNEDDSVHGILVQHPLPAHLDEEAALEALGHRKDVDGISPQSLGRLVAGMPGFRAATPLGMMRLLDEYGLDVTGKRAVVIGRSVILGKPAALMLLERHATVTICHSRTQGLREICRFADVLLAAVGRAEMVRGDWIKPGAVVLDAGYNRVEGRKGDVGDVAFDEAREVAGWITPVPGGVGPMTVAMLLSNVVDAAEAS
ncbi:MAG: transcription antitermination factor NusB [Armatimonadota bacterium]